MTQGNTVAVAAAEATASAQVEAKDLMRSFANLEVSFKDNQDHVMMRMKSEKTSALDEINQAGQSASKATTVLRTDAEAFAQKAKDQWANHYARTESSLREKSDKSSAHVSTLQSMTGNVRKVCTTLSFYILKYICTQILSENVNGSKNKNPYSNDYFLAIHFVLDQNSNVPMENLDKI